MFRSTGEKGVRSCLLGCLADLTLLPWWLKQGTDEERRAGSVGRELLVGVEAYHTVRMRSVTFIMHAIQSHWRIVSEVT